MMRAAILFDDRDRVLGKVLVPETTFVIRHKDGLFIRTEKGVRLKGGGIGAQFVETDPLTRDKLDPV